MRKAFVLFAAALLVCGAFLCCPLFTEESDAFSAHQSTRGTMTNSTAPTSTDHGTTIYGTVLNPYTGLDVTVNSSMGVVYVQTGSQARINLGGTSQNHSNLLSHGWAYSNGTYTRTVTADMQENWFYLNGKTISIRPVSNPGYAVDGQYWYGASSSTEPLLGLSLSSASALTGFGDTVYLAVGASVYLGPFPYDSMEGDQYLYPNSIGLSTASNGAITGVVSTVGTAKVSVFCVPDPEEEIILTSVSYSDSFTVGYNANGGSCNSSSTTVAQGSSTVLPAAGKSNCTFLGWYTAQTGGSRVGGAGDNYSPQGNIILFAHWKDNTLSINAVQTQYSVIGQSVSFTVTSSSDPVAVVSYTVNGGTDVNISGGSSGTMNVKIVGNTVTCSSTTVGTYQFTLTASANNYPSSSTTVTVQFAPVLQFMNTPQAGALNS